MARTRSSTSCSNGFAVKPFTTNKCLDVDGGTNRVQQWSCYGTTNQTFSLTRE